MLKKVENKIISIKDEVYNLGKSVIEANQLAFDAIKNDDTIAFKESKKLLTSLAQKSDEVDNLIVATLALYNLEAKDLREMVSCLKITNEIVRAASNTRNFIKGFEKVRSSEVNIDMVLEYSVPLHKSAITAFETAIEIIRTDNKEEVETLFHKTAVEESKTDDLYSMIEKNLLKNMTKNLELSKDYFDTLSAVRKLDKVAGRALSIANLLVYAEIGGELHQQA